MELDEFGMPDLAGDGGFEDDDDGDEFGGHELDFVEGDEDGGYDNGDDYGY